MLRASPAREEGGSDQSSCPSVRPAVNHRHTHTQAQQKHTLAAIRCSKIDACVNTHTQAATVPQVCLCSNEDLLAVLLQDLQIVQEVVLSQVPLLDVCLCVWRRERKENVQKVIESCCKNMLTTFDYSLSKSLTWTMF